ncbi:MAG: FkbM family methyltransferase [Alphaproteobacteria bacterium]
MSIILRGFRKIKRLMIRLVKALPEPKPPESPEEIVSQIASTIRGFERMQTKRPIPIKTVIDIGASDGSWSKWVMRFYPKAKYKLIEANPVHLPALKKFCQIHKNTEYVLAAAGSRDGDCFFDDSAPFGGQAWHVKTGRHKTKLPMAKIDSLVKQKKWQPPFLLKLDTHGVEMDIIKGAEKMLQHTELAIIEAYTPATTLISFYQLCFEMEKRGFAVVDFSEPLWRPKDLLLWQMDLFFIKKTSQVFKTRGYV